MKTEEAVSIFKAFLVKYGGNGATFYLGVDPGKTGGLALVFGKKGCCIDMPVLKLKKGKGTSSEYDLAGITRLLRPLLLAHKAEKIQLTAGVERTAPNINRQSRRAAFLRGKGSKALWQGDTPVTAHAIGYGGGLWPLMLATWRVRLYHPLPASWKPAMGLAGKSKDDSIALAARLYPEAAERYLTAKSHHNRAEALLLAHFAKRSDAAT